MHLNARKFFSALVPQCLRAFYNGLLRFTRNDGLFTVHSSLFTEKLSALVPQCIRTFCNGLLRFTRNDGLFTTHHSRLTKAAFTLAETLIVIGIIGVVAALTLPNLNHATGDKEKVTRVKKIYSSLTDAVDRAQVIYGPCDTWNMLDGVDMTERVAKRISEFMKVSKDCGFNDGCWSENDLLFTYGDGEIEDPGSSGYSVVLADGTALTFMTLSGGTENFDYSGCKIRVDIDGPNKGKKQLGSDIFDFFIEIDDTIASRTGAQTNQLIPSMGPIVWNGNFIDSEAQPGNYATAWVIQNGNLDYLKCPDELNWETQTSCK